MPKIMYDDKNYSVSGGTDIEIDSELSEVSEKPVQNKIVTEALNTKLSADDLDGYQKIPENASIMSSLSEIKTDQTYNDHVEVYLDANGVNENGQISNLTSTGADIMGATVNYAGVMTATDKVKLDGIEDNANNYTLPTAAKDTLGGVKTTSTITSTANHTACPIINGIPYYKNTTYSTATTSASGLMSADDKIRLNNLAGMTYISGQVPINSSSGIIDLDGGYYYIISLTTSNPPHSLWLFDNVINYNPYNGGVTKITGYSNDVKVRVATMDADNNNSGIVIEGCDHSSTSYKIYKLPF